MKSKITIIIFLLFFFKNISAQTTIFSENMGSPTGTTTIVANNFQNNGVLNYSNGAQTSSADVRSTSASSSYTGASAGGNVYFTTTSGAYGFSIEDIDASNYNTLSLQFGYKKEAAATHASFSVEYWNGTSWTTLANSSSTLFNEAANASAVWYLSKVLSLPTDAQISGLKIRFVKTGTVSIRIDDVKLSGTETAPTVTNTTVASITSNSATFAGDVTSTGGSSINATGTVYSTTAINSNPVLGGSGVTTISTSSPNAGTGSFSNGSGTVFLPNVQYSYNSYATKSTGLTGYGTVASFYTLAVTPSAPIVSSSTGSSLVVAIGSDSNSPITTYAILETTTGNYVQSNGTLGTIASYQTATTWSNKTVTGLSPSTTYIFKIFAKNETGVVTSAGPSSNGSTVVLAAITISGTLSNISTTYGTASPLTSFSFTGSNLTDNIIISAPTGFEISKTVGGTSGYATSQTIIPSSGIVSSTTVYIRLAATTSSGNYSGDVSLSSTNDGIIVNVPTALGYVAKRTLTITGITILDKVCDGSNHATISGALTLNGIITSDIGNVELVNGGAIAYFADVTVGNGKLVYVYGYTLNGSAAGNYVVHQPSGLTANILANMNSDIILNSSSPTNHNENIDYSLYQGTTLSNTGAGADGSIGVLGFYLRDGGPQINDGDNLPTELTDITINLVNSANIRSARLFVGSSPRGLPVAVNGASSINFTGLTNIIAPNNEKLAISLRVTFNTTVTDDQQLGFTIAALTAKNTGSSFATFNGGGLSSVTSGDVNRIEVIGNQLEFVQQPPSNVFVQSNMSPSPTLQARDINGNLDLDFLGNISITSSGILTTSPVTQTAFANGIYSFSNIMHENDGTGLLLTASATGFLSVNSNLFDVDALITPLFLNINPICVGETLTTLPTSSVNSIPITGSWSPALDNTQTTTYTFTPDPGQNADTTTLVITVNPVIIPTFSAVPPINSGTTLNPLPSVSNNGISGSWSPAPNNTTTTTYTFTPSIGECATSVTLPIVVNNSGGSSGTYSTTPTGNSSEVGITEGELSVSLTGAATYNIPIDVPPGINGVVPQISLSYNSQSGNGLAGYGWNISGVSSMTRISATKFHDNSINAPDLSNNDRLALDGQRLILKSGIYWQNGAVYETENYSNLKITGVFGYFVVEYPDGSIAHYGDIDGNISNSRSITEYSITYWQNAQGVRINYYYTLIGNSLYIEYIKYGINELNSVKFTYAVRHRIETAYIGGESIGRSLILKIIKTIGSGTDYKRYGLSHGLTGLRYDRLISITELTGDGSKSYNPTVFNYEDTPEMISTSPIQSLVGFGGLSYNTVATVQGDYDGDGKLDFLLYPILGGFAKTDFFVFNQAGPSANTGLGPFNVGGKFEEIFSSSWLNSSGKLMPSNGISIIKNGGNVLGSMTFNTYSFENANIILQNSKVIDFPTFNVGDTAPAVNFCNYSPYKVVPKEYFNGDFN